jgi:mono/diheme cytochrome c family protein
MTMKSTPRGGWSLALVSVGWMSIAGCRGPEAEDVEDVEIAGTDESTDDESGELLTPTYWQDVAPIYFENCVTCHREDGIGPFVLDDPASAATWAPASAIAAESGQMPPWLVTSDGSCGEWAHSKALESDEIATIVAWVAAGAPEGEPRDDLQMPDSGDLGADAFELVTPEFQPEPQGGPFAEFDEYRCFLSDPQLDHDVFLTSYQVVPGNRGLVHHVLTMPIDPTVLIDDLGTTNLEQIQALDDDSPDRAGWPCFAGAGTKVALEGIPISWAPGQGVVELPANSGSRIAAGSLLVTQIHYNMADPDLLGQTDSSKVRIRLADQVEHEGIFDLRDGLIDSLLAGDPDWLPPGKSTYEYTWSLPVTDYLGWFGVERLDLWGFFPHMHAFGRKLSMRLLDAEGNEIDCLGDVQRWDFGWQLYYFYQQPTTLEAGQTIEVTCTYDTTAANEAIWPGWGTHNEMCLAGLYLIPS